MHKSEEEGKEEKKNYFLVCLADKLQFALTEESKKIICMVNTVCIE